MCVSLGSLLPRKIDFNNNLNINAGHNISRFLVHAKDTSEMCLTNEINIFLFPHTKTTDRDLHKTKP